MLLLQLLSLPLPSPLATCGPYCPLASPELRQWEEQGELFLPLTFLFLVLSSLLLYLAVSLMDPGYVTTQPKTQVTRDGPGDPNLSSGQQGTETSEMCP